LLKSNTSSISHRKVQESFPKNNFESITPTAINGVYEVYTGNQIYYYMPKDDVIIYGPLISKDGVNITRESSLKKMAQKMASLPLDSALKSAMEKRLSWNLLTPIVTFAVSLINFLLSIKM